MIYGKDGYATALNKAVAVLPISDDNYETLMRGKTLDEYITFFDESFGEELPDLAGRWKARMEAAKEEEATEDEMITEEEAEVPEEADELKPEVEPETTCYRAGGGTTACSRTCSTARYTSRPGYD